MMNRAGLGLAIGAGYVLGRTRKLKLALAVGSAVAGKRMNLSPRAVKDLVSQQLQNNPQFKEIGDQLREDLRGVGQAASGALVERRLDSLADRLHGRTAEVRERLSGAVPTPDLGARDDEEAEEETEDTEDEEPRAEDDEETRDEDDESRAEDEDRDEPEGSEADEGAEETEAEETRKAAAKRAPAKKTAEKAAQKASTKKAPTKKTAAKKTAAGRTAPRKAAQKRSGTARSAAKKTAGSGGTARGGRARQSKGGDG